MTDLHAIGISWEQWVALDIQDTSMSDMPGFVPKGKIICPQCSDPASRVKRKLGDRIASLISPVKRYRCDFCGWTAALPRKNDATAPNAPPDSGI